MQLGPWMALALMGFFWMVGCLISRSSRFYWQMLSSVPARSNAIDGLRGFLALVVLLHHAVIIRSWYDTSVWKHPSSWLEDQLGPVPVSLFFMITGFLFWSKAMRASGRLSISRLLVNRLRRLAPAYWASTLLVVVIVMIHGHFELNVSCRVLLKTLAKLLMLGIWSWPYSLNLHPLNPVNAGVVWSLQYEWFFYLALPALALLGAGRRFFWLVLPLTGLIITILLIARQPQMAGWVAYFPLGMLTAELVERKWLKDWPTQIGWTLGSLAMLAMALSVQVPWLPIHLLVLPFFIAVAHGNPFFGLLQTRSSRFLGTISYSIYLLHGIVLSVVLSLIHLRWPISGSGPWLYCFWVALVGLLTVVVSAISYRWIEHPWLTRSQTLPTLPR